MPLPYETIVQEALTLTSMDKARLINKLSESLQNELRPKLTPAEWHAFIEETAGSLAHDPIQRWPQGDFETREEIE